MTTKQALETIDGAEIMSINTPIRKLQDAVLSLMSAAKRCMKYDAEFFNGELERVVHCCDFQNCTALQSSIDEEVKWFCDKWKGHPIVDPTDFCSYGEKRREGE